MSLSSAPGADEKEKVSSYKEIGMVSIRVLGLLVVTVTGRFVALVKRQDTQESEDSMMALLLPTATTQSAA